MSLSRLAGVVFACVITSLFTTVNAQTPVNESQCDELIGSTPSLYGLCMAYMAAQEKAGTLGQSPAVQKILQKYEQSRQESDPPMPGLCPCWTATQLEAWIEVKPEFPFCVIFEENTQAGFIAAIKNDVEYAVYVTSEGFCGGKGHNPDGGIIDNYKAVDAAQHASCYEDAIAASIELYVDNDSRYGNYYNCYQ